MISIITVTKNTDDWLALLAASVKERTVDEYEIVAYDNGETERERFPDVRFLGDGQNIGHGRALNELLKETQGGRVLILDVDAHILLDRWDEKIEQVRHGLKYDIMAAQGFALKPIRPACMYLTRDAINRYGLDMTAIDVRGAKFDVGVLSYFQVLSHGGRVGMLHYAKTQFTKCWGEEYMLNDERLVFHHYYGARFQAGKHQVIDGRTYDDFLESKNSLIEQSGLCSGLQTQNDAR